jgi:hypothetical protein
MLLRWSLGVALSLLAHVGVVAIGLLAGARSFTGTVEVEIVGVNLEELKDLPLGGPQAGEGKAHSARRPRSRAPQPPADGTLASRADKDDTEKTTSGASAADDETGPAPTSDLGAYAPQGSRLTILMRLDRLRGTDYASPVGELLMRLPDGRDFVTGTGLDLFNDLDALLVATPNPLDASVTFVAVRHRLDDAKVRAALTHGARASDYTLTWRTQDGRPIAERHPVDARRAWRDDRLIVLAAPGLTVVTPRAYRALLLAPASTPDAGTAPESGGPDGGATTAWSPPHSTPPPPDPTKRGWATLLTRIDAEEGLMPPDGAVMLNAVDIFKSRAPDPGAPPLLYGMPVPASINAVIGVGDSPALDVVAEFKTEAPAQQWEAQWPAVQRKLRTNPLVVLSGFSTLVTRAQVEREGRAIHLHLAVSRDETLRLLALATHFMNNRFADAPQ